MRGQAGFFDVDERLKDSPTSSASSAICRNTVSG